MRIVLRALFGYGEDMVGFADGDEARACVRVVGVAVGVVLLGEGVELAFDLGMGCRVRELEHFVVVREAIGEQA